MALGIGDVVRVSPIFHVNAADQQVNNWDVIITTTGSGGNEGFQVAATEWMTDVYAEGAGMFSAQITADDIAFYHRNGTEPLLPAPWTDGPTFTGGGELVALQTAIVVFFRSDRRGTRGRKFLPTIVEGLTDNGVPGAVAIATANGLGLVARDEFTSTNGWVFHLGIWSEVTNSFHPITSQDVSPYFGIQRRRRPGRGS